jgi:hypothetical protein
MPFMPMSHFTDATFTCLFSSNSCNCTNACAVSLSRGYGGVSSQPGSNGGIWVRPIPISEAGNIMSFAFDLGRREPGKDAHLPAPGLER